MNASEWSAEVRLTLACVAPRSERGDEKVRELVSAEPIDRAALVALAAGHGVAALVHRRLRDLSLCEDLCEGLRPFYLLNAARNLLHCAELVRIGDEMRAAGVEVATWKGVVVAQQAYGDIALREMADIDILVPPAKVRAATAVLERNGYANTLQLSPHELGIWITKECEAPYENAEKGSTIDLHWGLTNAQFPIRLSWDELSCGFREVEVPGGRVTTFGREDNIVVLANHGGKHMWERVEWIAAFANLMRDRDVDWDLVATIAARAEARKQLHLACRLASSLFAIEAPPALGSLAGREEDDVRKLCEIIEARVLRQRRKFTAVEISRLGFLLLDRRASAFEAFCRSIFVPTVTDWRAVELPKHLYALHWIVRPVRLLVRRTVGR